MVLQNYTCPGKFNSAKVWAKELEFDHSDIQIVGSDSWPCLTAPANTATLWHSLLFASAKTLYTRHLDAVSLVRGMRLIELAWMLVMLCQGSQPENGHEHI